MKPNALKSVAFTVVCVILGILIALQMKNVNLDNLSEYSLSELQEKIIEYANKNEELSKRNFDLNKYCSLLENDKAAGDVQIQSIINEKERAAIFAGLREVKNYGIEIRISCAQDISVNVGILLRFVDDLRSIGAQAISVNDERIVAMSEIKDNGDSIVINGKNFVGNATFTIKAITNPSDEKYILDILYGDRDSILSNIKYENDQYDISIEALPELTIRALGEDSIAFKIDLLIPDGE